MLPSSVAKTRFTPESASVAVTCTAIFAVCPSVYCVFADGVVTLTLGAMLSFTIRSAALAGASP